MGSASLIAPGSLELAEGEVLKVHGQPVDRAAFADDLTAAVLDLAARYHHDGGRSYRLVVASHPKPADDPRRAASSTSRLAKEAP